jgi:Fe-Mn family superoxide dismutase
MSIDLFKRKFVKSVLLLPMLLPALASCKNSFNNIINKPFFGDKTMSQNTTFQLPELPYAKNALVPHISENTINYHYGKHHQAYVTNLNNLIANTDLAGKSLEEIIAITATDKAKTSIFNNAAQVWNHTFYWHSIKPNGGGVPTGKILAKIEQDFGSYQNFVNEFKNAAATQFGSGWAWLVIDAGKLKVVKTGNAETPITTTAKPLITIDVWEHAYYLDFQNARPNYIDTFLNHLVNWDFATKNLENN